MRITRFSTPLGLTQPKRIMVVGSYGSDPKIDLGAADANMARPQPEKMCEFRAACAAIGAALVEKKHKISVGISQPYIGSDSPVGVASWNGSGSSTESVPCAGLTSTKAVAAVDVILGADKDAREKLYNCHPIIFSVPAEAVICRSDHLPALCDSLDNFQNGLKVELDIHQITVSKWPSAVLLPNLKEVDGIILIGGTEVSAAIGYSAYVMGIPIVALTSLEGAAEDVYKEWIQDELDLLYRSGKLSINPVKLTEKWEVDPTLSHTGGGSTNEHFKHNLDKALKIVTLLEELIAVKARESKAALSWVTRISVACILLAFLWAALFSHYSNSEERRAFSAVQVNAQAVLLAAMQASEQAAAVPDVTAPLYAAATQTAVMAAGPLAAQAGDQAAGQAPPQIIAPPAVQADALAASQAMVQAAAEDAAQRISGLLSSLALVLWLLLFIASYLGAGLRLIRGYFNTGITITSLGELVATLALSMLVAFGLALFYLIGGIAFTSDSEVFGDKLAQNFPNIAIGISILGLAAGALLPVDTLFQRLDTSTAKDKE